jgi:hypothetical protein
MSAVAKLQALGPRYHEEGLARLAGGIDVPDREIEQRAQRPH